MQLKTSVAKVLDAIKGKTALDPSFLIEKVASLGQAGPHDLAVVLDPDEEAIFSRNVVNAIKHSKAGIILASKEIVPGKCYLIVEDPLKALRVIKDLVETHRISPDISPAATVSPDATLGAYVTVGAGAVIEAGATVGYGCIIEPQAYIGKDVALGKGVLVKTGARILERCTVGDGSIINPGVVIGADGFGYHIRKTGLEKIPHLGTVRIGLGVEIGSNSTIDRALFDETIIGDGSKIGSLVHIAHNVVIGRGTAILAHTTLAGSVRVGDGCFISGHVVISDHVTIGNRVRIVGKSGVMKDLADGEVVAGVPSMPFRKWRRLCALLSNAQEVTTTMSKAKQFMEAYEKKSFLNRLVFWR